VSSGLLLDARFSEALAYAAQVHRNHWRKGTETPYLAHLLAVSAIVLEDGGSQDEAIAALLHDAVEDRGGEPRLRDIRRLFGDDVARIVEACSDTVSEEKETWLYRKQHYVAAIADKPPGALRVSAADKVHNARAILHDYRELRERLWVRFNQDASSADAQLSYYRTLVGAFDESGIGSLARDLRAVVEELESLIREELGPDWAPTRHSVSAGLFAGPGVISESGRPKNRPARREAARQGIDC